MAPAPPTYAAALSSSPPWLSLELRTDRYASEGDLLPDRPPIPSTYTQAGSAASPKANTLGSLSQPFPPCLVELPPSACTGQVSPLWETSAHDWDPRSLPQRPQASKDRTSSLSPQYRESSKAPGSSPPSQTVELQGAYSQADCLHATDRAMKLNPSAPPHTPQGGHPPLTDPSTTMRDPYPRAIMEQDPEPEACTSWRNYVQCMPTKQDFRMLIQEVRDTCRSEIYMLRTDLHHLSAKVASIEEETYDTKMEISHIHDRLSMQASAILKTSITEAGATISESVDSQKRLRMKTYK